jgi:hypothetical protein
LAAARQYLERQLLAAVHEKINADYIKTFYNKISSVFGSLTFTDKRFILREVFDALVINGDGVTIYGIIPIYEDESEKCVTRVPVVLTP